jgi:hypothetical protein
MMVMPAFKIGEVVPESVVAAHLSPVWLTRMLIAPKS